MKRLVLDASSAVRLVLGYEGSDRTIDLLAATQLVIVPRLYFAEVSNALWKYVRAGSLDQADALERAREARTLVNTAADDESLADEALVSAVKFDHPVYDLLYAVLARRNGCPVLTSDEKLRSLLSEMRIDAV